MLQAIMDQKLFLYGMIVAGIVGVWCLFWSNRFYHIAIKDMSRRKSPKGKWTSQVMELYNRRKPLYQILKPLSGLICRKDGY